MKEGNFVAEKKKLPRKSFYENPLKKYNRICFHYPISISKYLISVIMSIPRFISYSEIDRSEFAQFMRLELRHVHFRRHDLLNTESTVDFFAIASI